MLDKYKEKYGKVMEAYGAKTLTELYEKLKSLNACITCRDFTDICYKQEESKCYWYKAVSFCKLIRRIRETEL